MIDILEVEIMDTNDTVDSSIDFRGEYINTLTKEQISEAVEEFFEENGEAYKLELVNLVIEALPDADRRSF